MVSFKQALVILLASMGGIPSVLQAQNNTNSPYSYSGIGEINHGYLTRNRALGGVASSIFSNNHYNYVNPASIGFIDKTIIDFGLRGERGTLRTKSDFRDFNNGNFNYFGVGFRAIYKKDRYRPDTIFNADKTINKITNPSNLFSWATGLSITPYSSLGGDFQQRLDTSFATAIFSNTANGGLTSVGFNNGFKIGKYISLGYSLSFMWGQSLKTRLATFPDTQNIVTLQDLDFTQYNGFNHTFGLGFVIPLNKKMTLSSGISYQLPYLLNSKQSRTVRSFDYNIQGILVLQDTILNTDEKKSTVSIPSYLSAGFTFTLKGKFSFGAEYAVQNWSDVKNKGWNTDFANYNKLSLGITINPESNPTKSMHNPEIYLGLNTANLNAVYYDVQGRIKPIKETGISFGIGLPVVRDVFTEDGKREKYKSMIYLSGEYIKRGDITDGRIREDLYRISIGMSLTDLWFIKRKYR
ncbi:MAG: hypothetical protein LC109_12975 [Bacteroidia bacterium]|nr:hypothetical protein [Bacteroidia bacterium]